MTSGVPQGRILGPLLFIIFLNYLPSAIACCVSYLFADDTKCSKTILSPSESCLLQHGLDFLSRWCQDIHLSFNAFKCCVLQFTNRAVSPMLVVTASNVFIYTSPIATRIWVSISLVTFPGPVNHCKSLSDLRSYSPYLLLNYSN